MKESFSWLEINKSALIFNLKQYRRIIGPKIKLMAIIKSNAYGHGMVGVAKIIEPKVDWFGVVNLAEALELRKNKIRRPILVLSYYSKNDLKDAILKNVSLVIYNLDRAKLLSRLGKELRRTARIQIKIDTGTSRLGILGQDAGEFIRQVQKLPNLKIEGVFSHFAASEENQSYTQKQLEQFNKVLAEFETADQILKHFASSAATLIRKDSHYNLIRLGIALYGLWPSDQTRKDTLKKYPWFKLEPALTWKTKIIQIKNLPARTYVGYGCSYRTKRKTKLAILPIGYWEGFDRHLGNQGEVLIGGQRCPILGRICMNLTMVDATEVKNVKENNEVVLIGRQGQEEIRAEDLARKVGTINYEVVTRINPLLPRLYL